MWVVFISVADLKVPDPEHWAEEKLVWPLQNSREEQDGRAWVRVINETLLPLPTCLLPLFSDIRTLLILHFFLYLRL